VTVTTLSSVATFDFDLAIQAPSSGTLPSTLNFDLTATATEHPVDGGCAPGNLDDTTNNVASVEDTTGIPATRLLDGSMITNTNSSPQTMILTFVDSTTPLDSFSQVVL